MTRPVAVLRPEPGNAATAARAEALGLRVIRLPLFAVHALRWTPPAAADHDALILTSANAVRHGGAGLAALRALPVFAVGEQTAIAARAAGFVVHAIGAADASALIALVEQSGFTRALYLCGRDRMIAPGGPISAERTVYASDPLPITPPALAELAGSTALLHSARAARRLAALVTDHAAMNIAALSPAILAAAGPGWAQTAVAASPDDRALFAAASILAD